MYDWKIVIPTCSGSEINDFIIIIIITSHFDSIILMKLIIQKIITTFSALKKIGIKIGLKLFLA